MASKSPSHSKSATNSTEETQSWSPPPPPKRPQPETQSSKPVRKKTRSTRLRTGIDKHIPGVPIDSPPSPPPQGKQKGISIKEPSQEQPKKRKETEPTGKGKEKVVEEAAKKTKKARTKRASSPQDQSPPRATKLRKKKNVSPFADNAIEDIRHTISPPEGFITTVSSFSTKEENDRYKDTYLPKVFCASVAIDIKDFYKECHFDLSPWIKPYESFVSIACPYTPSLVRMFYFMMEDDSILDEVGDLVEEKVSTTVRGVKFSFSAETINTILKIENPPPMPDFSYSNQEVFETLIPGKPFPPDQAVKLTFKPSEMPKEHRLLWYIYSRNFIPKGGNYTYFTSLDYKPFTAFVRRDIFNIGEWLFQGMKSFKFARRPLTHIPYPSLVSVILFYHKIWYVGTPNTLEYPLPFGKHQMNLMHIKFDVEGVAQSQASQANEEAQSAPPPPQAPLSDDIVGQIKHVVDSAIAQLTVKMDFELGKIRAEMTRGHDGLIQIQDALKEHLQSIEDQSTEVKDKVEEIGHKMTTYMINQIDLTGKVDMIIERLHSGVSSSAPGPSSAPASDLPSGSPTDGPSSSLPDPTPATDSPSHSPVHSPPSHSFSFPSPPHTSPVHTTSSPPSTSPPHTTPVSEPQPSPTTPATQLLSPPLPSPSTATTELFPTPSPYAAPSDPPIDPLTAMVIWTPPLVILDPDYVDDDKGGETSNED